MVIYICMVYLFSISFSRAYELMFPCCLLVPQCPLLEKNTAKVPSWMPLCQIKHEKEPSGVTFQWRKRDKLPSRGPFQWTNKCPLRCPSRGENSRVSSWIPIQWRKHDKVPSRVPFQWRKRDKVSSRLPLYKQKHNEVSSMVPFWWRKCEKSVFYGCLLSFCPYHCFSPIVWSAVICFTVDID